MNYLTMILAGSVFLGANIFSVNLGFARLSIYRVMFLLSSVVTAYMLVTSIYPRYNLIREMKENDYIKFYAVWMIYAFFSVVWAVDFTGWIKGIFFISVGSMTIIYMSAFLKSYSDIKKLYYILFFMIGLHQIFGWIELLTNTYFWADLSKTDRYNTFASNPSTRVPITTFANQNDYATLLVAGIVISLIIFFNTHSKKEKSLTILSIFSSLYLIERTVSRANTLALVILFAALLLIKGFEHTTFRKTIKAIAIALSTFLIIYVLISPVRTALNNFTMEILIESFPENSSNRTRINLLLNGLLFLAGTLGFGVGAGNVEYWMDHFRVFSTGGVAGDIVNMHNWFMEILTSSGVVIFCLYIVTYVYMMRRLYVNYKYSRKKEVRTTSYILLAYLFAFIVSSVSSANNIFIEWQWVFWGFIIAFIRNTENDKTLLKERYDD